MKMNSTRRLERLKEIYGNGGIGRRRFLGLTAATAATMGVTLSWGHRALADVKEVRFDGWGGVVQDALHKYAFEPYTAKTGRKVVEGSFDDEDVLITKIKSANPGDYQIVHSSGMEYVVKALEAAIEREGASDAA